MQLEIQVLEDFLVNYKDLVDFSEYEKSNYTFFISSLSFNMYVLQKKINPPTAITFLNFPHSPLNPIIPPICLDIMINYILRFARNFFKLSSRRTKSSILITKTIDILTPLEQNICKDCFKQNFECHNLTTEYVSFKEKRNALATTTQV